MKVIYFAPNWLPALNLTERNTFTSQIYNILRAHPEGQTIKQIRAVLDLKENTIENAIQGLQSGSRRHILRLAGNPKTDAPWLVDRILLHLRWGEPHLAAKTLAWFVEKAGAPEAVLVGLVAEQLSYRLCRQAVIFQPDHEHIDEYGQEAQEFVNLLFEKTGLSIRAEYKNRILRTGGDLISLDKIRDQRAFAALASSPDPPGARVNALLGLLTGLRRHYG